VALSVPFDFASYADAMQRLDAPAWLGFYADDAEWLEYKHTYPPRSPRVMSGKEEIEPFLQRVAGGGVRIHVQDEVVGPERVAFCLWVTLGDGRRIIEHIIVHHRDGKITRQVDVESWDPEA